MDPAPPVHQRRPLEGEAPQALRGWAILGRDRQVDELLEFLVLLVETDGARAMTVADALRRRFESHAFKAVPGTTVSLTLSLGVAAFDGHPDYQRLLDRADGALQKAKERGRNRCERAA